MSGKKNAGKYALVSAGDLGKVIGYRWYIWDPYAFSRDLESTLHAIIMGERPSEVPADWVIDHSDRNSLNNVRTNLRFVPRQYNQWNSEPKGESKYKGVYFKHGKWTARFLKMTIGTFLDEREAGRAVARAALATWEWAEENDIITRHFSPEEVADMKEEGYTPPNRERNLPKGVCLTPQKKYRATYRCAFLGDFITVEEAEMTYKTTVAEVFKKEWEEHASKEITKNKQGRAVIALSGENGIGMETEVPEQFWHKLTFKKKWNYVRFKKNSSDGYAAGTWEKKSCSLHYAVWKLLHPDYVPEKGISIDHVDPNKKLDNREENLRLADDSLQLSNKKKVGEGKYPGVSRAGDDKWRGNVTYKGTRYCTPCVRDENEAARLLNELRLRVLGPEADMLVIFDD
jgi:hypothetical protein